VTSAADRAAKRVERYLEQQRNGRD
jgi:hypothetical protein